MKNEYQSFYFSAKPNEFDSSSYIRIPSLRAWRLYILSLLLITPQFLIAEEKSAPVQLWNTISASQRFDYGLEAMVEVENRMSTDAPAWRKNTVSPQLLWHYSPRYDFSIGYENSREWMEEVMEDEMTGKQVYFTEKETNLGFWTTTLKWDAKNWKLDSRQRFEFGSTENETVGNFRQQTKLSFNGLKLPLKLKPYIMDEWFFDMTGKKSLYENDFQVGVTYEINRSWRLDVYGMRMDEWDTSSNLLTTPVIGINVSASF